MNLPIRPEAKFIIKTLQEAGFDAYLVGGAVRDLLLAEKSGQDPELVVVDYDFATNAKPEEIQKLFPENYYENEFGTVAITHQDLLQQMGVDVGEVQFPPLKNQGANLIKLDEIGKAHESLDLPESESADEEPNWLPDFEITTYRSQEVYSDFRRPDPAKLEWGETIDEDLQRRDFTLNALALKMDGEKQEIIDPFDGTDDLESGLIRAVGDPLERFEEDALRMLRAVRFAVQLNMQIEDKTFEAIVKKSGLLEKISGERISQEFLKMMASDYPAEGIRLLDEAKLLTHILPELEEMKGVEQGGHHTTDVWIHSLDALAECPSPDPIVRLATLLHDVGKPTTYQEENGKITFYNHEIVGSRMADKIAKRLKLSKDQQRQIFTLVRYHMFYYQPEHTDAAIRRFMRKVGLDNINDILDLREADRLGSGAKKTSWRLEEMKQRIIEQLNQPMETRDLAVNGHDLMAEFGLEAGPWIGEVTQQLLEVVLDDPEQNTKENLLKLAQDLVKKEA